MKLNAVEFLLVNNPIRALVQEHYEARLFKQMASGRAINAALEIGCGNGKGARVIKKLFSPTTIAAIDLDPRMIDLARRGNRDSSISYQVMDAARLDFPDHSFDAVFDFGIIHHIPNWRDCLRELSRVVKPGGELLLEDLSIESFSGMIGGIWKRVLAHPYESMYTFQEFTDCLRECGFELGPVRQVNFLGVIRFFAVRAIKRNESTRLQ